MGDLWLPLAAIASVGTALAILAIAIAALAGRLRQKQRPRAGPKIDLFGS